MPINNTFHVGDERLVEGIMSLQLLLQLITAVYCLILFILFQIIRSLLDRTILLIKLICVNQEVFSFVLYFVVDIDFFVISFTRVAVYIN